MDDFDAKKPEEEVEDPEEFPEDEVIEEPKKENPFDLMKMINSPAVAALLSSGKDLFKKEEVDPNRCEITIKAPSEVVLKLFQVAD